MDLSRLDAEELMHLAAVSSGQGRFPEAVVYLKQAVGLEPGNPRVHCFLGMVYVHTGFLARALAALQQAVELDPELDLAHLQIGLVLHSTDREEEAAEAWRVLDRLGNEHPLVLFKKALQAFARQDYSVCRGYLNRAIEIHPPQELLGAQMRQFLAWANEQDKGD